MRALFRAHSLNRLTKKASVSFRLTPTRVSPMRMTKDMARHDNIRNHWQHLLVPEHAKPAGNDVLNGLAWIYKT